MRVRVTSTSSGKCSKAAYLLMYPLSSPLSSSPAGDSNTPFMDELGEFSSNIFRTSLGRPSSTVVGSTFTTNSSLKPRSRAFISRRKGVFFLTNFSATLSGNEVSLSMMCSSTALNT